MRYGTADDLVIFCGSGATAAVSKLIGILELRIPAGLDERYELAGRIPQAERPVVFVGPYEQHSNELPWRESIADVVVIGEDADGHIDLADLGRQLDRYARRPLWRHAAGPPRPPIMLADVGYGPDGEMDYPRCRSHADEEAFPGYLRQAHAIPAARPTRLDAGPTGRPPEFRGPRWFPLPRDVWRAAARNKAQLSQLYG